MICLPPSPEVQNRVGLARAFGPTSLENAVLGFSPEVLRIFVECEDVAPWITRAVSPS